MAEKTVAQKLGIKPNHQVLILNAPDGFLNHLGALPDGAQVSTKGDGQFDVVQLFVSSQAELEAHLKDTLTAVKPGGMLWLTYPKISSGVRTDITRDKGWDAIHQAGFVGIALVSVDEKWSAMRFRPAGDVRSSKK